MTEEMLGVLVTLLQDTTQALAESPIEDMDDVDAIPGLITTLHDVIDRLQDRWDQEFE